MMMISGKAIIFFAISMVTLIISSEAFPFFEFEKVRVIVHNEIDKESITTHCWSSDDDLGTHQLAHGAEFSWHFRVNFLRTTKFYCDFTTNHGSGNYGVYTANVGNLCYDYCFWKITTNGPCLQLEAKDAAGKPLFRCQDWKKH